MVNLPKSEGLAFNTQPKFYDAALAKLRQQQTFEGLTLEKMPQAIEYLVGTVNQLQNLLLQHLDKEKLQRLEDRWLNTADLIEYHPDHPARSTIYAWVAANIIPYHKTGKKLQFLQSEIDEWIKSTRNKTDEEMQDNAINYVNQRRIAK